MDEATKIATAAAENTAGDSSVALAKKKVVVKQTVPVITPWAFRETKLRDTMVKRITDLKPDGNPDPIQLENVRKYVLAEIAALPPEVNVVEVSIETQCSERARQSNVIVFPKTF